MTTMMKAAKSRGKISHVFLLYSYIAVRKCTSRNNKESGKKGKYTMNPTEGSGMMADEERHIGKARVLVYRFGSHKSSLNLTDQAENRASPVNSEDYGNGCLATNHFGRQKTQEGLSLSRLHFIVKCFWRLPARVLASKSDG